MQTDPGWTAAFSHIPKALFLRRQLVAVRPAIIAARAAVLAPVVTAVVLGLTLTVFGAPNETDYLLTGAIVGGTAIAAGTLLFRIRYGPLAAPEAQTDLIPQFLSYATVMSAVATVPTLSAFVCFFLGGGYPMYALGAVGTVVLLSWPANPTHAMVVDFGRKRSPAVDADVMWAAVVDPD